MFLRNRQFWLALLIILLTIFVSVGNFEHWWNLRYSIGPFSLPHWLGWFGAGYIVIFAPLYAYIKRHTKGFSKPLLNLHLFGNLISFFLISVHFSQQASRPPEFASVHSTGLILYSVVSIMVLSGFFQRFGIFKKLLKSWRFIHISLTLTIYFVLSAHILQFFNFV
jgi:hypothetical protein